MVRVFGGALVVLLIMVLLLLWDVKCNVLNRDYKKEGHEGKDKRVVIT